MDHLKARPGQDKFSWLGSLNFLFMRLESFAVRFMAVLGLLAMMADNINLVGAAVIPFFPVGAIVYFT
jgi:hypothetical protein